MYRKPWHYEAIRIGVILGLTGLMGWSLDSLLLGLMVGLVILVGIYYRHSAQLFDWSVNHEKEAPDNGTYLSATMEMVIRREDQLKKTIRLLKKRLIETNQGIESLNDGIVVLDRDGHIINMNHSAQRLLSLRRDDRGQQLKNLVRSPQFNEYLTDNNFREPLVLDTPQQSLNFFITRFSQDQMLILVRDVTERKRVETMRQNFIADVSHELRTPLTVVNGYLEVLQDQELSPAVEKARQNMQGQAQRMTSLVNDLIELSKLESVTRERRGELFSLVYLCQTVLDQLSALRSSCRLVFDYDDDVYIYGFQNELQSVISNLVTNAIKYGDGGTVTVTVQHHHKGVELSVEDTGPGIPQEHLDRLTERFYRVDSSRETDTGGSGLGLAIVKHALDNHEAELQIVSHLGRGSRFSFVLPESRIKTNETDDAIS